MKNSEIRFRIEFEDYERVKKFSEKYFKSLKTSEAYRFIFMQGIQKIEAELFKGKIPALKF